MGPSGAGKDAVLGFARARLDGRDGIAFAHRYATRPASPGHPNELALSEREFAARAERGVFAFAWDAWGVRYGVGIEVRAWADHGMVVVVSGSREHFVASALHDESLVPVVVTASRAERERRLRARAREDEPSIARRVARGDDLQVAHPRLVTIDNEGPLERAGSELADLLVRLAAAPR